MVYVVVARIKSVHTPDQSSIQKLVTESKSNVVGLSVMRVRAKLVLNGSVYSDGVYTEGVRQPVPPLQQNDPEVRLGSVSGTWVTSASLITSH